MADETGAIAPEPAAVQPGLTTAQRIKGIMGGSAGNLVEWYDWFAYTSFSLYFADQFFPNDDPTAALLKAQIPNIVSFMCRPLGAWVMGVFADRAGRKTALIVAVLMMCFGSLIMALAPTYAQVGGTAMYILIAARILQGLSVGGQYGAAATYMSEMATKNRRGFWSSFQYVTLIAGQLLAVIVLKILQLIYPEDAAGHSYIHDYAWRYAFWFGAILALAVFFIQKSLHETESFKGIKEKHPMHGGHITAVAVLVAASAATLIYSYTAAGKEWFQVLSLGFWEPKITLTIVAYWMLIGTGIVLVWPVLRRFPAPTLAILGLTAAGTSGFYAYSTYMLKFLQAKHGPEQIANFSKETATWINMLVLAIFMLAQPFFGHFADKYGRKAMLLVAFGLGTVAAYPVFTALGTTTNFWMAVLWCTIPLLCLSGYTSISAVVKAELFPAHVRALGVALPYAIANAIFGALVEPRALAWKKDGHESYFFIYIAVLMAVGLLSALVFLKETKHHSLITEG